MHQKCGPAFIKMQSSGGAIHQIMVLCLGVKISHHNLPIYIPVPLCVM